MVCSQRNPRQIKLRVYRGGRKHKYCTSTARPCDPARDGGGDALRTGPLYLASTSLGLLLQTKSKDGVGGSVGKTRKENSPSPSPPKGPPSVLAQLKEEASLVFNLQKNSRHKGRKHAVFSCILPALPSCSTLHTTCPVLCELQRKPFLPSPGRVLPHVFVHYKVYVH
jgi:hypothetical protein